jgi:transposase InsO family protein
MGAMESELMSLGIATRHSRPYHPQTCGKVERFHQTMKKYLAAQDPAETKKQLVGQLNRFASYYNTERPHRGVGRRTPLTAFLAREKVGPIGGSSDLSGVQPVIGPRSSRGPASWACRRRAGPESGSS